MCEKRMEQILLQHAIFTPESYNSYYHTLKIQCYIAML